MQSPLLKTLEFIRYMDNAIWNENSIFKSYVFNYTPVK